jgi:tRNA C32,U32 (ribose-2'-O)-methylase TrmJ
VRIPTSPRFPSLNLSHAVQILAYLLYRRLQSPSGQEFRPVSDGEMEEVVRTIVDTMSGLGFFRKADPREMGVFWRDLLARAALEKREAERLRRIFHEIRGLASPR